MSTAAHHRVVVLGDVINDILVRPLSAVTSDSDTQAEIVRRPGGSAANLACWLGSIGCAVSFVGRVGIADHAYHSAYMAGFGVEPHLAVDGEHETGTIVVIVDEDGRRTMLVDRGANLELTIEDVPLELLRHASLLHLTGYSYFEAGVRATALAVAARARAAGMAISVDPSSVAFLHDVGREQFLAWTHGADLCFPNRDEAAFLSGTSDPVAGAERLSEYYGTVVVTLDGDGAVVARRGAAPIAVPAHRVRPVDTTGAGDAFCAGFLDSWLRHRDAVEAAAAGARVAQESVVHMGARPAAAPSAPLARTIQRDRGRP